MEEDNIFTLVGVLGFAVAVIALLLFLTVNSYNFNESQFIVNNSNVSINSSILGNNISDSRYCFANGTNIQGIECSPDLTYPIIYNMPQKNQVYIGERTFDLNITVPSNVYYIELDNSVPICERDSYGFVGNDCIYENNNFYELGDNEFNTASIQFYDILGNPLYLDKTLTYYFYSDIQSLADATEEHNVKSTWLEDIKTWFLEAVDLSNYYYKNETYNKLEVYNKTEIDNRYSNNTGDQNLSTYVQGNMSSETTTTYTPTNGSALSFDGVNDYVNLGDNQYTDLTTAFTIAGWVKFSKLGTSNIETFAAKYQYTPDANTMFMIDTYSGGTNNKLRFAVKNSANTWKSLVGVGDVLSNGVYYFIVGTYDGSVSGGTIKLYVNGSLKGTVTSVGSSLTNSNKPLVLGAATNYMVLNHLQGSIDEVLLFNRSLNSTEIEQLYNSGNGLYADTAIAPFDDGLVSGWHFDEGSGTTAIDVTGRNNGTLVNGPSWVDGKVPHNIATQVLGAIGLMPWVSATNFISTDFSLQWIGNSLKNPWNTISTLGNFTNRWNVHLNNVTMNGTQGWSGNCVNSSILNGIIVGCND